MDRDNDIRHITALVTAAADNEYSIHIHIQGVSKISKKSFYETSPTSDTPFRNYKFR